MNVKMKNVRMTRNDKMCSLSSRVRNDPISPELDSVKSVAAFDTVVHDDVIRRMTKQRR
jgi:hypothetical protein